MIGRKNKML